MYCFIENSLTHRFPQFPPRNFSLVTLAVCSLTPAAPNSSCCQAHISLGLAESRILLAAPADSCPRTPLIFCTVQLRTLYAARSLATFCLSTTSGPGLGKLPCYWVSMVISAIPPFLGRGLVTTTTKKTIFEFPDNILTL